MKKAEIFDFEKLTTSGEIDCACGQKHSTDRLTVDFHQRFARPDTCTRSQRPSRYVQNADRQALSSSFRMGLNTNIIMEVSGRNVKALEFMPGS